MNCIAGLWRKSSQGTSHISSVNNQANDPHDHHHSPWYWHNNNLYAHTGPPQSPMCHCHHHGNDSVYCRSMCMPSLGGGPSTANDSMLLQQFIQTQQMLINSMSQCNQLLWDQQREINNLSSALLLVSIRNKTSTSLSLQLNQYQIN